MSLLYNQHHFIAAIAVWVTEKAGQCCSTVWDPLYCGIEVAAAAAAWIVWISWVVRHGSIRGFFHRRGGRLGNSGLYSHSQAGRLCHLYGTRILWVALHLLRGSDELELILKVLLPCYYLSHPSTPTFCCKSIGWGIIRSYFHIPCVMTWSHCSTVFYNTVQTVRNLSISFCHGLFGNNLLLVLRL